MLEAYWAEQNAKQKQANQQILDDEKALWKDRMDIAQAATDFLIQLSDRRIEQLDKEIAAANKQADFLRQLAVNGNIDAKDSLAEQQRIADEAERKKAIAERRKQQLTFANTAFQTYGQKIEAGSQNPLAETLRDLTLLQQAVAAFTPAFLDGTEDTGTNGRGVDGKGGFHAILHPNERVMTKEQNKRVGPIDNETLADLAWSYQNGKLISSSSAPELNTSWESVAVVKQLKELQRTIENKPEHSLNVENVVQGAMDIVSAKKVGRDVVYNRYKIK
jgi:parvulin-like peptidyl-prolyl isomerase